MSLGSLNHKQRACSNSQRLLLFSWDVWCVPGNLSQLLKVPFIKSNYLLQDTSSIHFTPDWVSILLDFFFYLTFDLHHRRDRAGLTKCSSDLKVPSVGKNVIWNLKISSKYCIITSHPQYNPYYCSFKVDISCFFFSLMWEIFCRTHKGQNEVWSDWTYVEVRESNKYIYRIFRTMRRFSV